MKVRVTEGAVATAAQVREWHGEAEKSEDAVLLALPMEKGTIAKECRLLVEA